MQYLMDEDIFLLILSGVREGEKLAIELIDAFRTRVVFGQTEDFFSKERRLLFDQPPRCLRNAEGDGGHVHLTFGIAVIRPLGKRQELPLKVDDT